MNPQWLALLCDPYDGGALRLEHATEANGRIVQGTLVSSNGRRYPIRQGIPIFVTEDMQPKSSVASFAYEWDEFGFLFARNGWLTDLINPLVDTPDFFKGKVVVDAGAGSGAQSRWMVELGAQFVYSLELSDVIFTRHAETIAPVADQVFAIQADIARPPIRRVADVVYCVNVAQHTADPRATFRALAGLLKGPEARFVFNIYVKRSEVKFRVVRAVRACIRVLPFRVWKALAGIIAGVGYALAKIPPLKKYVQFFVPISHSYRETWLDTYDAFGAHWYQQNMTREDQLAMFRDSRLAVQRATQFGYVLRHPLEGGA